MEKATETIIKQWASDFEGELKDPSFKERAANSERQSKELFAQFDAKLQQAMSVCGISSPESRELFSECLQVFKKASETMRNNPLLVVTDILADRLKAAGLADPSV